MYSTNLLVRCPANVLDPKEKALSDCLGAAEAAYASSIDSTTQSYDKFESAFIDDYLKGQRYNAWANALEELHIAASITVATWGTASWATFVRGNATLATVARAQRGLDATIKLANAGRIPSSTINVGANLLAQAKTAHSANTLITGTTTSLIAGGTYMYLAGQGDGIASGSAGTVADTFLAPGRAVGPVSMVLNTAQVVAPLVEYMDQRTAALTGQGVPGLETNNRLHQIRLGKAGNAYQAAVADCHEQYGQ